MIQSQQLLQYAATLPPARARIVLEALAAKDKKPEKKSPTATNDFDEALEAMAVAMEARIAQELEEQFTE